MATNAIGDKHFEGMAGVAGPGLLPSSTSLLLLLLLV
eukprot:CAMPEP_0194300860 /NCGR_PEP_ID=MMETSP0169-20130528/61487_1 /TAXON_ID=218684 /ORGANISM="Corethron pennatum, Strain L29A3" /LENGTH=36 /DNA_ID= /DNA_START= /DNA_END= /DNA_ORIENTATION=